ncbi:hypothetical protein D3C85_1212570 [compost metagenome]
MHHWCFIELVLFHDHFPVDRVRVFRPKTILHRLQSEAQLNVAIGFRKHFLTANVKGAIQRELIAKWIKSRGIRINIIVEHLVRLNAARLQGIHIICFKRNMIHRQPAVSERLSPHGERL